MVRTGLVALVVLLAVGIGVLAWQLREERKDNMTIELGQNGLTVEKN